MLALLQGVTPTGAPGLGEYDVVSQLFQVFGYPGIVMFIGWRVWTWYTNVKHPEEMKAKATEVASNDEYKKAWLVAQQEHTKELQGMRRDLNDVMLMLSYGQPEAVAALLKHRNGGT